ncbi:MAG TPA: SDR family oxidoreductase [Caulobacteraceae bacterium]|jgi:NAD(P)-dependent dehydrogenase (short-subunit alcohol dehydrogenase family)|nr:SDR family oxidoreductase [Caulobacteraceae bacterium]
MTGTALIVGASRGIGLGLTGELAGRGWNVVATARDLEKSKDLIALADTSGGKVRIELVDIAEAGSPEALRERLSGETFDVLVVNAGIGGPRDKNPRTVSHEEFCHLFVTNALAPVRLAEIFSKQVAPQTGVVGFMTSVLGSVEGASAGGMELYRASKAALNSFTRSFAARHKDKGWVVLSLHPGWVKTDMGGPGAAIDVATSVKGLADVIERARKDRKDGYFDYKGDTIAW